MVRRRQLLLDTGECCCSPDRTERARSTPHTIAGFGSGKGIARVDDERVPLFGLYEVGSACDCERITYATAHTRSGVAPMQCVVSAVNPERCASAANEGLVQ